MSNDETESSRKRAAALREQIARIAGKAPAPEPEGGDPSGTVERPSPRSLIEKRMRDLDRNKVDDGNQQ